MKENTLIRKSFKKIGDKKFLVHWCHYVHSEGTYNWDFSVVTSFNTHSSNTSLRCTVMDIAKNNIKKLIEIIDKPVNTILNDYEIEEKIVVETKYNLRPRKNNEIEKDVLQKYIGKKYPLMSKQKISKIIEEKADKYIDIDHYHEVNGYKLKTNNKCKCKKCTTEENVNKNGK